ncbi:MAG: biotin--[acetyl-CoA-carboxylase] ligase [Muribaculaceae bacterium]|nr:biotin--[acetyl-CoA-carboxylase] ligase [Muribaculaceae bacterium]
MKIVCLDTVDSTNTWVAQHEKELPSFALVMCEHQTTGRGQKGNKWESEPGKNITASLIFHPDKFKANAQFLISEAIAIAIVDFLKAMNVEAKVKWPNDIYVGDRKICGILVENVVIGQEISRSIAGFGININQTCFLSDAPNPVSLCQLTGREYDIFEMVEVLSGYLERNLLLLSKDGENIHERFLNSLWRKDGMYEFYDRKIGETIEAKILDVAKDGVLTLATGEGEKRQYIFKEVEFIL